jgi:hypothetical protein
MTIAIILVLISAERGEGLAKKVRQFSRGQVYRELLWLHVVAIDSSISASADQYGGL